MKMNEKYYPIDLNVKEAVKKKIAKLAKAYTPEWIFNEKDPDIGSTIAILFADMLNDNAHKTNMLLYKYHIELMNMIGITPKPAVPAKSVVVFSLLDSAPTGVFVKKNTQLLAYPDDENKLVFETESGIYLTKAKLTNIYTISEENGKIISVCNTEDKNTEEAEQYAQETETDVSFNMFDFTAEGIQKNMLIFGNKNILENNMGSEVYLKFEGVKVNDQPSEGIFNDITQYELGYLVEDTHFMPFLDTEPQQDGSILIKDIERATLNEQTSNITLCLLKKGKGAQQKVSISGIHMFASLKSTDAEFVYVDDTEQDVHEFLPFTDTLTEYRECFIGSNIAFSKKGANAIVSFDLNYNEKQIGMESGPAIEYKHMMKKPKEQYSEIFKVKAQLAAFEYFNGTGWRKLPIKSDMATLFAGDKEGKITIEFEVPSDIEKTLVNAFEAYWIRISAVQVDNSFRIPAVHKYPIISNLKVSYKYKHGIVPEFARSISGVEEHEVIEPLQCGEEVTVFNRFYDSRDCVFLGFNAPMESGPVSIYFDISVDAFAEEENNISFEYSSSVSGGKFKELKIIDKTEKFKHSGCIVFNPPSDFVKTTLFNVSRYWLKIVNINPTEVFGANRPIKINNVKLNAVEVANIQTMEEEEFYVDQMDEGMTFELSSPNVLNADVFVNEVGNLTLPEKEELLKTHKDDIIAQTDALGSYINFFVKWHEVDSFMKSGPDDRHYIIDRNKGRITFGDAKHGKIPQSQPRVAIKVFANSCAGELGNVEAGTITVPSSHIRFLADMQNIIPAYAGYNIESINNALERGSELMSNHGGLISKADFVGTVKHFSDAIDKVRCEVGVDKTGAPAEDKITIAILMKEFYKSNEVFISLRDAIKADLLRRCDVSIKKENLELIEPVFIKLNTEIWATTTNIDQAFEIQNTIKTQLSKFLHPVSGNFDKQGWKIGIPPQKNQIYSFLKTLNLNCVINKIVLTGFNDSAEFYEIDYENATIPIFSTVVSGEHNVHVDILKE